MYPSANCKNEIMDNAFELHSAYSKAFEEFTIWLESGDNYPEAGPPRYNNKEKIKLGQIIESIIANLRQVEEAEDGGWHDPEDGGWHDPEDGGGQDPDPHNLKKRYPSLYDIIGEEYINWSKYAFFMFGREQISTYRDFERVLGNEMVHFENEILPSFEDIIQFQFEGLKAYIYDFYIRYGKRNDQLSKQLHYEACAYLLISYFRTQEFKQAYDTLTVECKIHWVNKLFADLSGSKYGRDFILKCLKSEEEFFDRSELKCFIDEMSVMEPYSDDGLDLYNQDFAPLCITLMPFTFGGKRFWGTDSEKVATKIRKLLYEGLKVGLKFVDITLYENFDSVLVESDPSLDVEGAYDKVTKSFLDGAFGIEIPDQLIFMGKLTNASIAHIADLIDNAQNAGFDPQIIQGLKLGKMSFSILDIGVSLVDFKENPNLKNGIGLCAALHGGADNLDDAFSLFKKQGTKLMMKYGTLFFGAYGVLISMYDAINAESVGAGFGHFFQASSSLVACVIACGKIAATVAGETAATGAVAVLGTTPLAWIAFGLLLFGLILIYIFTKDPMEEWLKINYFGKEWQGQNYDVPTETSFRFEDEFPRQIIKHNSIVRPINFSAYVAIDIDEVAQGIKTSFNSPKILEDFLNIRFYFYRYIDATSASVDHTSLITIYPTNPNNSMEKFSKPESIKYYEGSEENFYSNGTYEYMLKLEIESGKVIGIKAFECYFYADTEEGRWFDDDLHPFLYVEAHISYAQEGILNMYKAPGSYLIEATHL